MTTTSVPGDGRPSVLLDCDPGHDDVIAILVAARRCRLLGITTVSGNAPLGACTHNALVTTQLFGIDVPVVAGADRPLVAPPRWAPHIHGTSGLDGPVLPPLTRSVTPGRAAEFLLDRTREHPGSWIVATGPLTNMALALRLDPGLVDRIAGIALMGGGVAHGNRTSMAEFNIWADPEAADVVFGAGAPRLVMMPLDVTHKVSVTEDHVEFFRGLRVERAVFLADVFAHFARAYRAVYFDDSMGPLHDPCAVLAVTDPELFDVVDRHVAIELTGTHTRGMTVVDQRQVKGMEPANCSVALDTDGARTLATIVEDLVAWCGADGGDGGDGGAP